jgi:hypothetical protein
MLRTHCHFCSSFKLGQGLEIVYHVDRDFVSIDRIAQDFEAVYLVDRDFVSVERIDQDFETASRIDWYFVSVIESTRTSRTRIISIKTSTVINVH